MREEETRETRPQHSEAAAAKMSFNLPVRSSRSQRNQDSRDRYFGTFTPASSAEAINGPVREFAPISDRLIVGVDFGTTFSG